MNISNVSERIADSISAELGYNEDKKEIIAYGIESVILAVIGFSAIVFLAFIFDALFPAVIATIFGGGLRKVSGGAHFNTPFKCLAFGAVIYTLIGVMANQLIKYDLYSTIVFFLILVTCLILVALLAPVDCEAKPIHSAKFRERLKLASIGFVIFSCIVILLSNNPLLNTSAVLGIGYQTITLLPVFNNKNKEVSV